MTTEQREQYDVLIKTLIVVGLAFLYAIGGASDFGGMKWLRRYITPFIYCGSALLYTRDWRVLLQFPLLVTSLSIGYGATETIIKITKRAYVGLALGLSGSLSNLLSRRWTISAYQVGLLVGSYIVLGVWNPFGSARIEEFVLGFLVYFIPTVTLKRRTN